MSIVATTSICQVGTIARWSIVVQVSRLHSQCVRAIQSDDPSQCGRQHVTGQSSDRLVIVKSTVVTPTITSPIVRQFGVSALDHSRSSDRSVIAQSGIPMHPFRVTASDRLTLLRGAAKFSPVEQNLLFSLGVRGAGLTSVGLTSAEGEVGPWHASGGVT